jgi:hypothetical protein
VFVAPVEPSIDRPSAPEQAGRRTYRKADAIAALALAAMIIASWAPRATGRLDFR